MMTNEHESQFPTGAILVATDGSEPAHAAAQVAIQIAKAQHLEVQGIYVVEAALVLDGYNDYKEELGRDTTVHAHDAPALELKAQGEETLTELETLCHDAGVSVTTNIWFGQVNEMVLEQVEQAGWLALGQRGRIHETDPQYLGEHFRHIAHQIRRFERPLLVGNGQIDHPIKRLLVAYNDTNQSNMALAWATELQRALAAKVVILSVDEDDHTGEAQQWIDEARTRVAEPDIANYEFLVRKGVAADEIVNVADEYQADLIVAGSYSHPTIVEWLVGSAVDQILRSTPLPMLIAS